MIPISDIRKLRMQEKVSCPRSSEKVAAGFKLSGLKPKFLTLGLSASRFHPNKS